MRVCLWLFSCCTLDVSLTFPPHLAVFLISFRFLSATQPNVLTAEGATLSRLAVEAALRALRWFGLKLGFTVTSIIHSCPTSTKPESHFYQILEGTKAFINVLTGLSLDSVESGQRRLSPAKRVCEVCYKNRLKAFFMLWCFVLSATAAHTYLCLLTSSIHTESKVRFRCSSGGSCKTCLYSTYLCKKVPGLHKIGIVGEMLSWCISASEGW